ncbi:protein eva-1 isoform X7 [Tribolium madens]|uniref:protein eva-1 isoform X7 n=1 Tax=Tribolium madens TaxID=41895 RepID=UPI001CF7668D|nr:protein eva-1 isoform X7 [Tribolium madens]
MGFSAFLVVLFLVAVDNGALQPARRVNVFALLSGTLRTYQRAGCDDEVVTLRCPPGTSISIEIAQYGKSAPSKSLCGPKTTQSSISKTSYNYNVSCLWPNSLQTKWEEVAQGTWGRYSLLQTVVEACQKKRQCKFKTSPKTFGGDPCPGVRKYVEVAYKCRPYEFRSKVACENERIQLKCNPNSRVAVYSASYGRTEYESIQCPQPQGVREETCLVSYATETVMQLCHGKRSCELSADISTFGSPCRPESRMYLKVIYTCVPRKVLKEQYEGRLEPDEIESDQEFSTDEDDDFEPYDAGNNEYIRESAASPPASNIDGGGKGDNLTKDSPNVNAKSPAHKSNGLDLENQERFYLYLIVSIAAAILLCLTVLVGRLLVQRHRARREAKFHATNVDHSLPNGFTDDISEVDADIDLTTPLPTVAIHSVVPVGSIAEVVRYPHVHSHTLRRPPQDTDVPRSLSGGSNSHYYYG